MRRETTLVLRVVWDDQTTAKPSVWDWTAFVDNEDVLCDIIATSDDRKAIEILEKM